MNEPGLRIARQTATFHLWPLNAFAHKKFETSTDMRRILTIKHVLNAIVIIVGLAMALYVVPNMQKNVQNPCEPP